MRLLKDSEYKTLEQLCALSQEGVKKVVTHFLHTKYKKVVNTPNYIYAVGDIPIALVAHMDTVFRTPAQEVYYDRMKNVMWSPQGLGADDRAGVFAILQIIKKGLRPHVIFTTDEEKGAVGASVLANEKCPFKNLRYIIQLDRRNSCDCVFYDCDNMQFIEYVEKFGFVEAIGSFTDISILCPSWGVAGVNLSIGYLDEHSISETLHVGHMLNTIDKVVNMLTEKNIPTFKYIPNQFQGYNWFQYLWSSEAKSSTCKFCHKELPKDEMIPIKDDSPLGLAYCCIDCISDKVEWCSQCGEAFEIKAQQKRTICEDCLYDRYH